MKIMTFLSVIASLSTANTFGSLSPESFNRAPSISGQQLVFAVAVPLSLATASLFCVSKKLRAGVSVLSAEGNGSSGYALKEFPREVSRALSETERELLRDLGLKEEMEVLLSLEDARAAVWAYDFGKVLTLYEDDPKIDVTRCEERLQENFSRIIERLKNIYGLFGGRSDYYILTELKKASGRELQTEGLKEEAEQRFVDWFLKGRPN
jgi:hypothetical protein